MSPVGNEKAGGNWKFYPVSSRFRFGSLDDTHCVIL